MTDKNSNNDEEEYKFSSDVDTSNMYGSMEDAAAKQQAERARQMKKIIAVVAIILIIFFLYKISGLFATKPTVAATPQVKTQVPQLNLQPVQNMPSVTAAEKLEPVMPASSKLQTDVDQLKEAVTNLQATISTTNETLQNVANKMEQQSSLLERQVQLLAEMRAPKKPVVIQGRKKRRMVNYFIEAMIPGRAWLKSQSGETLTVRIGDSIRGYEGEIAQIDSHEGVVLLTSGESITYRSDDR
jgi:intracellular multiplication protein IcmG